MTAPSETIVDLYERHAATYDRLRGKTLFERAWLDRFLALVPERAALLDIGCGSGEPIARHFLAKGHAVTGIDSAPSLVALCRQRFPQAAWQVWDMRRLALGRRFDGVIAWDSFFHLTAPDQRAMFPIFATHAAAGAALMFTSGPADGEAIGSFEGEPLYHASLAPEEYRSLLAENGFTVVAHIAEDRSCSGHTVWLARRIEAAQGTP